MSSVGSVVVMRFRYADTCICLSTLLSMVTLGPLGTGCTANSASCEAMLFSAGNYKHKHEITARPKRQYRASLTPIQAR